MDVPRIPVVLKFGGTSLGDHHARESALRRVRDAIERGQSPVVIASAMGRGHAPYATDALLALANHEGGVQNTDLLLSCGEIISAATFAALLTRRGIYAVALTGAQAGVVTDSRFGDANILRVEPHAIEELLDCGIVPVIAGFQGATKDGEITTLGRGGSDMSAIAIGHALNAERIDIYTDVSGVMTADPRHVARAQTVDRMTHGEMTELADRGAKVMHHKAALYARRTSTAYAIKGLHNDTGTIVDDAGDPGRAIAGVASLGRRAWVRLKHGDLRVLRRIAAAEISVNLLTIDRAAICFVVDEHATDALRKLLNKEDAIIHIRENCAEMSVVGEGLRSTPGIIATIVEALSRAAIELIHCTESGLAISALVPIADEQSAKRVIHEAFELDRRPSSR